MASCKTEWTSCMHGVRSVITASFTGYAVEDPVITASFIGYAVEDPVITASLPRYRGRYATVTEGMLEIPPEIRGHRWRVKAYSFITSSSKFSLSPKALFRTRER